MMLSEILVAGTILNLLLVCILFAMNKKHIAGPFRNVKKEVWILLVLILMAGITLRLSSPMQYLSVDENYRLSAAKDLVLNGKAEICHYSGYEEEMCRPYFKPFGSVIIFSAAFLISGISALTAVHVSVLFGTLCILAAFALARALFSNSRPALYAAGLLAAYPPLVAFSATTEDFMIALFFGLLSLFCLSLYIKNDDQKTLYLFLFSLAFALNTRIEFIALVPAAIFMLASSGGLLKRIRDYTFRIALILSSSFFIIYLQRLWAQISTESLYIFNQRLFIEQIPAELRHLVSMCPETFICAADTISKLISGFYYPIMFNIIIAAGIVLALRRKASFPWAMGLISLLLVCFYVASGFVQPILIIFAASFAFFPVSSVMAGIQDASPIRSSALSAAILLLLMLSFLPAPYTGSRYLDNLVSHTNYMYFNTEQRILEMTATDSLGQVAPETYVVSMSYNALSARPNINTVPLHTALSSSAVSSMLGNGSRVFFYDGYMCNNKIYNQTCNEFSRVYVLQTVSEYSLGNTTYTLYSVRGIREGMHPDPEKIYPYPLWDEA